MNINEEKFIHACENGDVRRIKHMLNRSIMKNIGNIAFRISYNQCNFRLTRILLEYCYENRINIDIHYNNEEAFIHGCKVGNYDFVIYLIEYGKKTNSKINIHCNWIETFNILCNNKNNLLIQHLLEYDIKKSDYYCLCDINIFNKENNYISILKYILEYYRKKNIILNINEYEEYAFRMACIHGKFDIVKLLVDYSFILNRKINIHECCEYIINFICSDHRIIHFKHIIHIIHYVLNLSKYNYTKFRITDTLYYKLRKDRYFYKLNTTFIIKNKFEQYNKKYILNNNIHTLKISNSYINIDYMLCFR